MSKILITGGAGYIGSMLCTKLLEEGHTVTAVDLLKYDKGSLNHLYFQKNFKLICDDIRKVSLMKKICIFLMKIKKIFCCRKNVHQINIFFMKKMNKFF